MHISNDYCGRNLRNGEIVVRRKIHDWKKLKREWLAGKYKNLVEIQRAYKIPSSTFRKRVALEKWTELREKVEDRADEIFQEKAALSLAEQQVEILQQQMKYAKILIGLGFGNFKGKEKIEKESDAIRAIFSGAEMQLKAIEGFRKMKAGEDQPTSEVNVTVNNMNVAAANSMTNEEITIRLKQIAEERKKLNATE